MNVDETAVRRRIEALEKLRNEGKLNRREFEAKLKRLQRAGGHDRARLRRIAHHVSLKAKIVRALKAPPPHVEAGVAEDVAVKVGELEARRSRGAITDRAFRSETKKLAKEVPRKQLNRLVKAVQAQIFVERISKAFDKTRTETTARQRSAIDQFHRVQQSYESGSLTKRRLHRATLDIVAEYFGKDAVTPSDVAAFQDIATAEHVASNVREAFEEPTVASWPTIRRSQGLSSSVSLPPIDEAKPAGLELFKEILQGTRRRESRDRTFDPRRAEESKQELDVEPMPQPARVIEECAGVAGEHPPRDDMAFLAQHDDVSNVANADNTTQPPEEDAWRAKPASLRDHESEIAVVACRDTTPREGLEAKRGTKDAANDGCGTELEQICHLEPAKVETQEREEVTAAAEPSSLPNEMEIELALNDDVVGIRRDQGLDVVVRAESLYGDEPAEWLEVVASGRPSHQERETNVMERHADETTANLPPARDDEDKSGDVDPAGRDVAPNAGRDVAPKHPAPHAEGLLKAPPPLREQQLPRVEDDAGLAATPREGASTTERASPRAGTVLESAQYDVVGAVFGASRDDEPGGHDAAIVEHPHQVEPRDNTARSEPALRDDESKSSSEVRDSRHDDDAKALDSAAESVVPAAPQHDSAPCLFVNTTIMPPTAMEDNDGNEGLGMSARRAGDGESPLARNEVGGPCGVALEEAIQANATPLDDEPSEDDNSIFTPEIAKKKKCDADVVAADPSQQDTPVVSTGDDSDKEPSSSERSSLDRAVGLPEAQSAEKNDLQPSRRRQPDNARCQDDDAVSSSGQDDEIKSGSDEDEGEGLWSDTEDGEQRPSSVSPPPPQIRMTKERNAALRVWRPSADVKPWSTVEIVEKLYKAPESLPALQGSSRRRRKGDPWTKHIDLIECKIQKKRTKEEEDEEATTYYPLPRLLRRATGEEGSRRRRSKRGSRRRTRLPPVG